MFLEGLCVLDLSRILAGPLCTQNLADMGARVLKIEPPVGDDTRDWGPPFQGDMAAYFQSCNRNKASLPLDLKDPGDRARLDRLIAAADVVVDNYPDRVRAKFGLKAEQLRQKRPDLITMSITGYGGDRADEPGYDIMIQAESGLMGITGPEDGAPFKVGVALVDVMTGMMAANGILAALVRRGRTGQGAALAITLYRTALYSLVNVASNYFVSGRPSTRWGNAHANIVPYQSFQMADRAVIIGAGNNAQFRRLCALLDIGDPAVTELDNRGRVAARKTLIPLLQKQLATRRSEQLLPRLKAAKIPAAPILRPDEALTRVRTWDPGALLVMEHAGLGQVQGIAPPLDGDGLRPEHGPPPLLGQGGEEMAASWLAEEASLEG